MADVLVEHDGLVTRHETQWCERAGARRIVFEEVERNVEGVEQPIGDRVVAAFGMPLAAAVAAAQMHADPHCRRRAFEHPVGDCDILVDQRAPVVPAGLQ
jgi:class 3 adenylate cyclase